MASIKAQLLLSVQLLLKSQIQQPSQVTAPTRGPAREALNGSGILGGS
ncbi:MAG: hypothetical protein U0931_24110 [Vulcanimicrobiota bacterium]